MPRHNTPTDFWARVKIGTADECWPWIGPTTPKGYGKTSYGGKNKRAHAVAFFLKHGFYPAATLHTCDNPPCCNDAHLFAGTNGLNNKDRAAKGRSHRPKNELHPACRITDATVAEIRALGETVSSRTLADRYSISYGYVRQILLGERRQP